MDSPQTSRFRRFAREHIGGLLLQPHNYSFLRNVGPMEDGRCGVGIGAYRLGSETEAQGGQ